MRISTQESGPFANVLAAIGGVILLVIGFMFSLVVLAAAAVIGIGIWGWFWWKTRKLRQQVNEQMREHMRENAAHARPSSGGDIIEGEAVVVEEETTRVTSNQLPESPDRRSPG